MTQASSTQPSTPHWLSPPWSLRRWQERGCASCFRRVGRCSPPILTKRGNSARLNPGQCCRMWYRGYPSEGLSVAGAYSKPSGFSIASQTRTQKIQNELSYKYKKRSHSEKRSVRSTRFRSAESDLPNLFTE